ncbi:hypothetical protein [Jeotgalibaca caeni]|uniref:hypothetical protein n=1 Tax=Jeotgalibaca caeni TaxID=3028623 RepID=UPI00237ED792|nr:hypothetical protein [Jeotgalibaca caeni]MDE1549825.1 hypothetical protein [Jeotgalibaca caeni]
MKKIISMLLLAIVGLVACTNTSAADAPAINEKASTVEIDVNTEAADTNGLPVILTPQLTGEGEQEWQYHWTMKVEDGMEDWVGFVIPEAGPQKTITNTGEPVEFGLFAEIMWVSDEKMEVHIQVEVIGSDSSDVLATDEITLVGVEGMYSLK